MIPKIIHYCWFGGKPKPLMIRQCIASWKKYMPDYEIVEWNESNFDINAVHWTKAAYEDGKYAFVADYVRFYALMLQGGVYLDTDVLLMKSFDGILNVGFFSALEFPLDYQFIREYHVADAEGNFLLEHKPIHLCMCGILAAIMGSEKSHPLVKDCLDFYHQETYTKIQSSLKNQSIVCDDIILAKLWKYGYKLKDETQHLESNITIYNSKMFGGSIKYAQRDNYAIHVCSSTWRDGKYFRYKKWLKTLFCVLPNLFIKD